MDFALGFKGFVYIREGESAATWFDDAGNERPLGFLVECLNFKLDVYPGTTRPERYASTIRFSSSRDDTVPASSLLLAVNSPQSYQGVTFYQQDCGLAPRKDSAVEVKAAVRDREMSYLIAIGEPIQLTDGTFLLIEDFSPTITFVKGRPQTIDVDQMRNPGYLIRLVRHFRRRSEPLGDAVSEREMDRRRSRHRSRRLQNLEYTVLSVAKTPFAWLFYAGGLVAGLSLLLYTFITFGSRSFPRPAMNIEELFTLSGTGLVIGALLSWLSLAFTAPEGSGPVRPRLSQFTPAAFIRRQSSSRFQSCRSGLL